MWIEYPRDTDGLKRLWKDAFCDEDSFIDSFFETGYAPQRCRRIWNGRETAAMLFWLDAEYRGQKMAYIYALATGKEFRGRGLCRALMEDTHALLQERGYAAAMLYPANETLRDMYRKLGYQDFGRSREFCCEAGGTTQIREISGEEYGVLRHQFLADDAVIQEGESLRLLEKCAKLYAGRDFLLAGNVEEDTLRASEFLGSQAAACSAVSALGCKAGYFCCGAKGMILPFRTGIEIPGYLGLVFD